MGRPQNSAEGLIAARHTVQFPIAHKVARNAVTHRTLEVPWEAVTRLAFTSAVSLIIPSYAVELSIAHQRIGNAQTLTTLEVPGMARPGAARRC